MTLPVITPVLHEDSPYKLVTTVEELTALRQELEAADVIAVDTETEGLDYSDIVVGICLSTKVGTGYYVPLRHEQFPGVLCDNQLPPALVYGEIGPVLERTPCVGHNIKFDDKMLQKDGVRCYWVADTLAISKLFGSWPSNGLKFLVKIIFGHDMAELESLFVKRGNKRAVIAPKSLSPEAICHYAVEDANWTLQLYLWLLEQYRMKHHADLRTNPLFSVETNLMPYVAEMECFGLPVSKEFLEHHGKIARDIVDRLEFEIVETIREKLHDPEYNVSLTSPPQLGKLLFEDLRLPVLGRSKTTNKPSTDRAVLEQLAELDPIARSILTHRTLKKLNNTYLEGLVPKIHDDLRLRGNFNQFGTASGRFSSSEPNLQNLPRNQTFYLWRVDGEELDLVNREFAERIRWNEGGLCEGYDEQKSKWVKHVELGTASNGKTYGVEDSILKEMWKCKTRNFVAARPDHYLVEADYSQVELRIMAGEAQEPTLLAAYANDDDVHTATAAIVFDVPDCSTPGCTKDVHPFCLVTSEQRQSGKTINFSLLYGAGADNIGKQLGISTDEAQALVDQYFEKLPRILQWIEGVRAQATRDGCAMTPFGRVRHFPFIRKDPRGPDRQLVQKEKREAVNFKIQGAAADVMKFALVRTGGRLRQYFGDKAKMVSTVHDSVLLEVHDSVPPEDIVRVLNHSMTEPAFLEAIQCRNAACAKAGQHRAPGCQVKWPALEIDVKVGKAWSDAKEIQFPEDMSLPAKFEGYEDLPKIRVQQVAIEREVGISDSGQGDDIFALVQSTSAPKYASRPVSWVLEVPRPLDVDQLNSLTEFLRERNSEEAQGALTLVLTSPDGEVTEKQARGKFNLTMSDEVVLRIKLGPCTLRQELDDIDEDEVLRGIDFGL